MEIKIGKSSRNCLGCDRPFVHGEQLKSLVRIESGLLIREDYCLACWAQDRADMAFSTWIAQFYDPAVADQEPPEAFSPLRRAFYECVESTDPVEMAKAYLAAQLLRRQKVFRLIKESTDPDTEMRVALFSDRIGNTLVEVRDPNLSYEHLEAGRKALIERLALLESGAADAAAAAEETEENPPAPAVEEAGPEPAQEPSTGEPESGDQPSGGDETAVDSYDEGASSEREESDEDEDAPDDDGDDGDDEYDDDEDESDDGDDDDDDDEEEEEYDDEEDEYDDDDDDDEEEDESEEDESSFDVDDDESKEAE